MPDMPAALLSFAPHAVMAVAAAAILPALTAIGAASRQAAALIRCRALPSWQVFLPSCWRWLLWPVFW
ncbi:hypothetical protein V6L77_09210 [Pannonibacter sp. Pt2-lr]